MPDPGRAVRVAAGLEEGAVMLKAFRDNLKYLSWVLWVVIAIFIGFVFVDFGGISPMGPAGPGDAAATVGGEKINSSAPTSRGSAFCARPTATDSPVRRPARWGCRCR